MSTDSRSKHSACGAACAALLAFLFAVLASVPASAHAVLVEANPADGAMLAAPPERLTLTFNEPVSPLVMRLLGPGGDEQGIAGVMQAGATLSIAPARELTDGTHFFSWRVVSADGHPVGGTVVFSVRHASEVGPPRYAASVSILAAVWLAKIAIYVGLFVGAGGVFFVCWMARATLYPVERTLERILQLAVLAVVVSVGLQGVDLLDMSAEQIVSRATWAAGVQSPYFVTAVLAFVACLAGVLALRIPSRRGGRALSALACLFGAAALAASGHAGAASPQVLMRSAVFVHALCLIFWIGALLPLAGLLLARPGSARISLRRFSRAAPFAVGALIASGAVLAVVQIEEVSALWRTDYGRLLLAKLGLLAVLFSIALYNRLVLTGRVLAEEPKATGTLARMAASEIVLVLAVLAVAAAWRFTPPPRALAALAAAPATAHMHTLRAMADVRFDPGHTGPTAASITVMTAEFGPLDAKEVLLVLTNKDAGIEPLHRSAEKGADGIWRVRGLVVPVSGRWNVRVEILISDFEKITLEEVVEFRP